MELSSLKLKQLLIFQEGAFKSQTFWGGFFFFFFFFDVGIKSGPGSCILYYFSQREVS